MKKKAKNEEFQPHKNILEKALTFNPCNSSQKRGAHPNGELYIIKGYNKINNSSILSLLSGGSKIPANEKIIFDSLISPTHSTAKNYYSQFSFTARDIMPFFGCVGTNESKQGVGLVLVVCFFGG